jgi:hypothetical protein
VPWGSALRVGLISFISAPLVGALAMLMTMERARTLLRELVDVGLPVHALHAAVPHRHFFARRLVAYTLATLSTPLALAFMLGSARYAGLLDDLLRGEDQHWADGTWPSLGLLAQVLMLVAYCAT